MNELKELIVIIVCLVVGILLALYVTCAITNKLTVGGEIAQIEQLRSDAQKVHTGNNEDVLGR